MMDNDKVIAEAVDVLIWSDKNMSLDSYRLGFQRGVQHLAETLTRNGFVDWEKLRREAVKK